MNITTVWLLVVLLLVYATVGTIIMGICQRPHEKPNAWIIVLWPMTTIYFLFNRCRILGNRLHDRFRIDERNNESDKEQCDRIIKEILSDWDK